MITVWVMGAGPLPATSHFLRSGRGRYDGGTNSLAMSNLHK
jgi:hypothetical protein